jgi:hypothetical protein
MDSPIPRYTFLGFELAALLDQGLSTDIEETKQRISNGTVLDWLAERYGGEPYGFDIGLYDDAERETITSAFAQISDAVNARKKFGVDRNGIALLVALCFQVIQGGSDTYEHAS